MAVTNDWGQAAKNSTNGFGKLATNTINEGAIYENSWSGDTALIGTSASFAYGKSSYNQGEADPTPTITGTAGGSFNADAGVVFVDTGSFNSSTGQIDLSATTIDNHIITYTVDGVQSGQTVGVTAAPYSSTRSFSFDGVDSYFDAGSSLGVIGSNAYTFSAWLKTSYTGGIQTILSTRNQSANNGWVLQINSTSIQFFNEKNNTNIYTENNPTLTDGAWHNIVIVRGGSTATNAIYQDGSPITLTINTENGTSPQSASNLSIGSTITSASDKRFLDGNLDEVSIWNTALSSDAITEIYNSGAPSELTSLTNASSINLKAWYKMGE